MTKIHEQINSRDIHRFYVIAFKKSLVYLSNSVQGLHDANGEEDWLPRHFEEITFCKTKMTGKEAVQPRYVQPCYVEPCHDLNVTFGFLWAYRL